MPGSSPAVTTQGLDRHIFQIKGLRLVPMVGAAAASDDRDLLLVADAIDRTGPVVGDEDGAILVLDDIGRAAEIALVAFDPAGREHVLLGVLAVRTDGDADDPTALVFMPVPRAVLGDQDAVLVLGRKLASGVELHAER